MESTGHLYGTWGRGMTAGSSTTIATLTLDILAVLLYAWWTALRTNCNHGTLLTHNHQDSNFWCVLTLPADSRSQNTRLGQVAMVVGRMCAFQATCCCSRECPRGHRRRYLPKMDRIQSGLQACPGIARLSMSRAMCNSSTIQASIDCWCCSISMAIAMGQGAKRCRVG